MSLEYYTCRNCGCENKLIDAHRNFLEEHGCSQPPFYCSICFSQRLGEIWEIPSEKRIAACSICGVETRLPFVPCLSRPVYCPQCFKIQNATNDEL
ncbi:MAG: zinc-binding protein [Candidatus Riflebacteria bacterium]|nr:zinc-binding protein [Candidatus Riflebacteria bacterium]